jgi:hypothetical protein
MASSTSTQRGTVANARSALLFIRNVPGSGKTNRQDLHDSQD